MNDIDIDVDIATDLAAINSVMEQFKIDAEVTGYTQGPSVTRYEVELGPGVKIQKITALQKNLAYSTAAESVRILAPIPGRSAVGIELPNRERDVVTLADLAIEDGHPLSIPVGMDVEGDTVSANLAKLPHLLVAGTTGSGKSSFINSILVSLLAADSEKVKLVLIDPKSVELTPYDGVAHLLRPVITEVDEAIDALGELVEDMEERYQAMRAAKVRNIDELDYPYIVVVIDELADLMLQGRDEVEPLVVRLLQKARAAGIHLVLATQRPSVDVVTGLIKANAPSRLAFSTASLVDSRVVLDEAGAEQLLGMGDGLFKPVGSRTAIRIQGAYVADEEIQAAVRRATATARVERMVNELSGKPDDGPTVLEVINKLIKEAETVTAENAKYLEELLKPKSKWWGGPDGKLDKLSQAPQKLGRATDTLVHLSSTLKIIRDSALEEV